MPGLDIDEQQRETLRRLITNIIVIEESNGNDQIVLELQEKLSQIECLQNPDSTEIELDGIQSALIEGNPNQALFASIFVFAMGFTALFANSSVIAQTSLGEADKNILLGLASLSATFARFSLGLEVNKTGGSKQSIRLLFVSLVGLVLAACINVFTTPGSIYNIVDYRAIMLAIALFLSGFGLGTISLVSNVINWYKNKYSGQASSSVGGYGGLAPGIFDFCFVIFQSLFGEELGKTIVLWLLVGLLITNIGLFGFHKGWRLVDSPCHQLMNKYGLSLEEASLLAKLYGQESFPSPNNLGPFKTLFSQLKNYKILVLVANYIVVFGGFLGMATGLRLVLPTWGYSATESVLYAGVFSFTSSLWRGLVGLPLTLLSSGVNGSPISLLDSDCLGGAIVNSVGVLLVCASSSALVTNPDSVSDPIKLMPILLTIGIGFGLSCAATLKLVSSLAKGDSSIIVSIANGLIAGLGPLGANIFNGGGGIFASQHKNDPGAGYIKIFYAFIILPMVSGVSTLSIAFINSGSFTKKSQDNQEVVREEEPSSKVALPFFGDRVAPKKEGIASGKYTTLACDDKPQSCDVGGIEIKL
jgi:nitrate/nitrite transporter NarK